MIDTMIDTMIDVRARQIYAKIFDSKKIETVDMVDRMFEREESKRK